MFNSEQRAEMQALDLMPTNQRCWCGWFTLGSCYSCPPNKTCADKIASSCLECGADPGANGTHPTLHRIGCSRKGLRHRDDTLNTKNKVSANTKVSEHYQGEQGDLGRPTGFEPATTGITIPACDSANPIDFEQHFARGAGIYLSEISQKIGLQPRKVETNTKLNSDGVAGSARA